MMRKRLFMFLAALVLCGPARAGEEGAVAAPPAAEFAFRPIFGDHMVLQRDRPIKLLGQATPGGAVRVAVDDAAVTVVADAKGEWTAVLPALPAGGPHRVSVAGAPEKPPVVLQDVLVGEVWLASGQSNMEQPVFSNGKFWTTTNGRAEADAANLPQIRLYNATAKKYVSPGKEVRDPAGAGWTVCTPDTAAPFSAVAFYFGREIQKELGVPVGLISAAWGGTRIEPWISEAGFASADRTVELARIESVRKGDKERDARLKEAQEKARIAFAEWEKRFYASDPAATAAADEWKNPGFDDSGWEKIVDTANSFPDGVDGVAWYRKTVELPADWAGQDLVLSLGAIDDCDVTYVNGVKVGATGTDTQQYWQAKRLYPVPGQLVKAGANVVAVRVSDMFSGGGLQSDAKERFLARAADKTVRAPLNGEWRMKLEFAADLRKIGNRPDPMAYMGGDERNPSFPATLYNSMIHPWTVYPVRGALWYQGESNAGNPEDYYHLQQLLVSDWRRLWNDPDFAFLFVQLAAYEAHRPANRLDDDFWKSRAPADPSWARFREAQAATLRVIPKSGMAVAMDCGDHSDIHPADKQTVAHRLAREALRICYGRPIVSAGPYYRSMEIKGDKVIVSFDNVGQGLVARGAPEGDRVTGFAIAGEDGKFVWANAVVVGDSVVVDSPEIPKPAAVRYGWVSYAENLNLFNKDGFPASPFRTDLPAYLGGHQNAKTGKDAAAPRVLAEGARVAIVGDSITEQKQYSRFMEMYLVACQPVQLGGVFQFGWSGDRAPPFARRLANDLLFYRPTVVTTCFGMNDGGYRAFDDGIGNAYRDGMAKIISQLREAGATVVVGGPGAVDTATFKRANTTPQVYNENLGRLNDIARDLARENNQPHADVHNICLEAMARAKAELGDDYPVMGGDGVHPGPNGQLAMAYAFLKALGVSGDIGAVTVTLDKAAPRVSASEGHLASVKENGEFEIVSTRWPFCFSGPADKQSTLAMTRFLPFNQDLNRFVLKVENAPSARVEVEWGGVAKTFAADELAKGVNLAEAFIGETPFQGAWDGLNTAVQLKQEYETWLVKSFRNRMPDLLKRADNDPAFKAHLDGFWNGLLILHEKHIAAVDRAFTPVTHTLRVTPIAGGTDN